MTSGDSVLRLLGAVFGCSADIAEVIRRRGRLHDFQARAFLVRNGDPITILFVIVSGLAQALVYSAEGQPVLLHEYRTGDFFGAVGTPAQMRHESDVVAVADVASFLLDGRELTLLAERHSCIGLALLRLMIERLQRTETRMYEHAALSAVGRIHAELLRRAREGADLTIRPAPILSELALHVSTSRETVSRAVNALDRRGIVRRTADALVVVAPDRLEELIV